MKKRMHEVHAEATTAAATVPGPSTKTVPADKRKVILETCKTLAQRGEP